MGEEFPVYFWCDGLEINPTKTIVIMLSPYSDKTLGFVRKTEQEHGVCRESQCYANDVIGSP
jgi:hypothetical protein